MTEAIDLATLTVEDEDLVGAFRGPALEQLQGETLPRLLPLQRWFGAKDEAIKAIRISPLGELVPGTHALLVADVDLGEETQRYLLPVTALWKNDRGASDKSLVLGQLRSGDNAGILIDGALDKAFARNLLEAMREERQIDSASGTVRFFGSDALRSMENLADPRPLGAEQSNVSIAFGASVILKLYRRLRAGEQPDIEVARFLTNVGGFSNTPEYLGEIRYQSGNEESTSLAAAFAFVPNEGDAWTVVTEALTQSLLGNSGDAASWIGAVLGRRTAEMHQAMAVETADPDFRVEPLNRDDVGEWASEAKEETRQLLHRLGQGVSRLPPSARAAAEEVLAQQQQLIRTIEEAAAMQPSGGKSRIHGDYHLGQVLVANGDVLIIDFEGEPKRSLAERRAKSSPLRDVAGMLRSFHYAAWTALSRYAAEKGDVPDAVRNRVQTWNQAMSDDFLRAYETHIKGAASYPCEPAFAKALADLFLIQKAIYEVGYELANRPDWVEIPLSGIQDLLNNN